MNAFNLELFNEHFSSANNKHQTPTTKPFLKWAGNKNRAKHFIIPHIPKGSRLVEPFAGSCAISLNTQFNKYLTCDVNSDLIELYEDIKNHFELLITELKNLFTSENNTAEAYYKIRQEFNLSPSSVRKSATFIYLNRHCFNGLCRYNKNGVFNVPFGKYTSPSAPITEIIDFKNFTNNSIFKVQAFEETFEQIEHGDVVYCDPPYVPISETSNFTTYSKEGFNELAQIELAERARKASQNGITVIISNHDTPFTREIYDVTEIHNFQVQRLISSKAATRGKASELIAIFHAKS
jgi:DNA adenine methylase